jgi:hypothetical protein
MRVEYVFFTLCKDFVVTLCLDDISQSNPVSRHDSDFILNIIKQTIKRFDFETQEYLQIYSDNTCLDKYFLDFLLSIRNLKVTYLQTVGTKFRKMFRPNYLGVCLYTKNENAIKDLALYDFWDLFSNSFEPLSST